MSWGFFFFSSHFISDLLTVCHSLYLPDSTVSCYRIEPGTIAGIICADVLLTLIIVIVTYRCASFRRQKIDNGKISIRLICCESHCTGDTNDFSVMLMYESVTLTYSVRRAFCIMCVYFQLMAFLPCAVSCLISSQLTKCTWMSGPTAKTKRMETWKHFQLLYRNVHFLVGCLFLHFLLLLSSCQQ